MKNFVYLILILSSYFLGLSALTLNRNNKKLVANDEDRKPVGYDVVREVFPDNESAIVYEPSHHQHTPTDGQHSQEVHSKNRQLPRKVKQISYTFVARDKFASGANQKQKDFVHKPLVRDEKSIQSLSNGENVIAKSEALQQEVQSDIDYTLPKMVVTIATTVAALFGMCLMAAIFQCCCRKKRSQADADDLKTEKNAETQRSKSPSPVKEQLTDNHEDKSEVDKLLVDDELGDFSMVQRETEILKSYRKPPPPKNRAKASRSPKAKTGNLQENSLFTTTITEEPSGSMSSRSGSQRTSPDKKPVEDESDMKEHTESTETENRVSFTAAQSLLESVMSEVKGQMTDNTEQTTVNGETTPPKERKKSPEEKKKSPEEKKKSSEEKKKSPEEKKKSPEEKKKSPEERKKSPSPEKKTNTEQSGANSVLSDTHINGGNIFLQIDPTVNRKENSEKQNKSKIPVKASMSVPTEGAKRRPPSDHKEERKFIVPSVHGDQMDELVKSLKSRMKEDTSQSARNLSFNKVAPTTEDEIQPVGRERCYSDPAKQNAQSLKQTHL